MGLCGCVLFQRPGAEACGKWVCVGVCCSSGLVPRRVVIEALSHCRRDEE